MNILEFDLQWAPLPKLLMQMSAGAKRVEEETNEQDAVFTVVCVFFHMHQNFDAKSIWLNFKLNRCARRFKIQ